MIKNDEECMLNKKGTSAKLENQFLPVSWDGLPVSFLVGIC